MTDDTPKNEDIEFVEDAEGAAPDIREKIKKFKDSLKKCEEERREYLDGWQRAKAEHINYKKDESKRTEEMAQFVAALFLRDILPILDSFAALENHFRGEPRPSEDGQDLARGVAEIYSQLMNILKKKGLEEIPVNAGDEFNPEKHESIDEVEANVSPGTIAEVAQKGYLLNDKVLRPARVKLSKQSN